MKIGERDTIAAWHWKRVSMQNRAPGLYMLDERTRLAGLPHDPRRRRAARPRGGPADRSSSSCARRSRTAAAPSSTRTRALLVPGRYRSSGFTEARYADKTELPKRARRDLIMHGAYEAVVDADGRFTTDLRGCSAWGWHSFNATPAGTAGHAVDPVHADADLQRQDQRRRLLRHRAEAHARAAGPTSATRPARRRSRGCRCSAPPRATCGRSRARSRARGYIEEIVGTYTVPGNVAQGGGIDQYGQVSGFMNFEIGAQGQGGKYVLDGLDYGAAVFNPEGDMGDIEMWELVKPMIYLGRRIKPNTAGIGRHRGGSSFESLLLVHNTPDFEIENIGAGGMFTSPGIFGGYPGAQRLRPQHLRLGHPRDGRARRGLPGRRRQRRGARAERARRRARREAGPLHADAGDRSTATSTSPPDAAAAASAIRCCARTRRSTRTSPAATSRPTGPSAPTAVATATRCAGSASSARVPPPSGGPSSASASSRRT